MDFGRTMIQTRGIVAKSNIRLVEETHLGDDPLDIQVCRAANEAAKNLLLGNDAATTSKQQLVDCSLYNEQHLPPPRRLIQPGDLVVVFESFHDLNFVYAKPNDIFSNRNGHFHHNDFLGKPYGCKIRSRNNDGLGFLYLLRPTPELWARSLPHRTQIVHELDASMIVHYLNLCPDMIVCESGTGSGAMSHAILRSIAPHGKLHTYEFNKMRVDKARNEFEGHGLKHLVEVHHRDVCGKKSLLLESTKKQHSCIGKLERGNEKISRAASAAEPFARSDDSDVNNLDDNGNNNGGDDNDDEDDGMGGFQIGQGVAHAIFLDLPEPWLAIPHAAYTIRPNGNICSYSPCMEQTQRTVAALRLHGFHSLRTVEARLMEYFVDEVELEAPPADLPMILTEETASMEKERCANGGILPKVGEQNEREAEDVIETDDRATKRRKVASKMLCARPFPQMRGHTAFLTFATAGNALRPDPNNQI